MAKIPCLMLLFAAIAAAQKAGSVEGSVINSVTHEPVKRAMVRLQGQNGSGSAASTDDAGKFHFDGVGPGEYTVFASGQGYVRRVIQTVTVTEEQKAKVSIALLPGGVVSGKVVDADGDPVANAMVHALVYSYAQGVAKLKSVSFTTTNDRGEYRISGLIPRRYYMMGSAPDQKTEPSGRMHRQGPDEGYVATYHPNALDPSGAAPVAVAAGAESGGMDIHRQKVRRFHVRGKVTGLPAQTVRGTRVMLGSCGGDGDSGIAPDFLMPTEGALRAGSIIFNGDVVAGETSAAEAPIRTDGDFDLAHVPPGRYCVSVSGNFGGQMGFARQAVTVSDKDVENVGLIPALPFSLHGSVVVEGAPPSTFENVRLMLTPFGIDWGFLGSVVNADGSFLAEGVLPITYSVFFQAPGNTYVKAIRLGDQESEDGRIRVTSGAQPMMVILATDAGQVAGLVKSASGDPASGMVALVPLGTPYRVDRFRNGNTSEKGRFTVTGVPPGDYQVFALEELDMTAIASPEYRQALESKGVKVTVHASGRESVDLTLIPMEETTAALGKVR